MVSMVKCFFVISDRASSANQKLMIMVNLERDWGLGKVQVPQWCVGSNLWWIVHISLCHVEFSSWPLEVSSWLVEASAWLFGVCSWHVEVSPSHAEFSSWVF